MGLFTRKKKSDPTELDTALETSDNADHSKVESSPADNERAPEGSGSSTGFDRSQGPFDSAEVGESGSLLDAGALWLPAIPGTTIQFTTDPSQQHVLGVVYLMDDSALQLQVFAAPKTRGIWDSVRLDMRTAIAAQGGSSRELVGPLGKELLAMMPLPNSQEFAPHRFMGVDGPRWLLRATVYGRAGVDETVANQLIDIVRQVVVNRGTEAHTPREILPLQLPKASKKHEE